MHKDLWPSTVVYLFLIITVPSTYKRPVYGSTVMYQLERMVSILRENNIDKL